MIEIRLVFENKREREGVAFIGEKGYEMEDRVERNVEIISPVSLEEYRFRIYREKSFGFMNFYLSSIEEGRIEAKDISEALKELKIEKEEGRIYICNDKERVYVGKGDIEQIKRLKEVLSEIRERELREKK